MYTFMTILFEGNKDIILQSVLTQNISDICITIHFGNNWQNKSVNFYSDLRLQDI